MDDDIAQRLARVELDAKIAQLRERARSAGVIAERGARIMTRSLMVLVPTWLASWVLNSWALAALGGAAVAALLSYGGVLAAFGALARRNAVRALRANGGELPEARIVR